MVKKIGFLLLVNFQPFLKIGMVLITMVGLAFPLHAEQGWGAVVDEAVSDIGVSSSATNIATIEETSIGCPMGPIGLILDKNLSPFVGGSGLISLWRVYMSVDDKFYPSSQGDTNAHMMLGRLTKLALEDVFLATGMVTQHEIFGHGFRAREFELDVFKYTIRPYSGYTVFSLNQFNQLSPSKRIAFIAGGMEANGQLAKQLRDRWLETNSIDEREGHFYFISAMDQTLYVMKTRASSSFKYENDVQAYVQQLNAWFARPVLSQKGLRHREMIDFLDPYLWYSLYGVAHYIVDGSPCFEYPMIPLGCYQYLPGLRLALAPYGPEYQLANYFRGLDHTLQLTLRYGNTGGKNSEGMILEMSRLWAAECLSFDGRFDVWCQPQLFTNFAHQSTRKMGGAAQMLARYRIVNNIELMAQFGYKTTGYMPGFELKRGVILKAGFFLHL